MDKGVVSPSYGLAENCVGLCFPPAGRGPLIDRIKRDSLANRCYAEPAGPDDTDVIEMVACGHPIEKNDVRIVDDAGRELGERHEGMLEFRGPSITKGYFRNEAKTKELFHDGWVKSGDRAYMAGGDIYITGRVKDIIIRAGRNTYPQEIEEAVSAIPGIRKGGVAAFGSPDPENGTERLIVMAETKETNAEARAKLIAAAHEVVTAIAGSAADDIVLVPPRGVPKTSSGKVRRSSAKELYETGRTDVKQSGVWLQIARLSLSTAGRSATNFMRRIGDTLYAGWWYLVTALALVAAFLTTMVLPSLSARWSALRVIARAALALTGIRVDVTGTENLPRGNAVILFNHTSYMDAVIIASVLPGEPAFIAKKEFADQAFAGQLHAPARRRLRRALRCGGKPCGCRDRDRHGEGRPAVRVLSGRHVHAPRRPARLLHGRVQGRGRGKPAGRAGHSARRAHAVARRSMVPAPHRDRRRDRAADPAFRHRFQRHAVAARCRPRRDAQARRRA